MKILDLFSGIGGFSLGLEKAGFKTSAFCEADPKCRQVLRKHWPDVKIYEDVRDVTEERLRADGIEFDIITGGFPCQDISLIGEGAGLEGDRSGLWYEMLRIISDTRPRYAIIENVSALRGRGLDQVLRGLAEVGYDAEWHCVPAHAVGAPHRRDRIWIIAYPVRSGLEGHTGHVQDWTEWQEAGGPACKEGLFPGKYPAGWWAVESDVGRVAHGVFGRVDRLKQLGNAVVPQILELIGKAIMEREGVAV